VLSNHRYDKIEITGGGEPTLHPRIGDIIGFCADKSKTQMYTCGSNFRHVANLENLDSLCLSIAHYNMEENRRIMGVTPDIAFLKEIDAPIKFSLLLHKSGISDKEEVMKYLEWARAYADKVVIRQLFEHNYRAGLDGEFVSSEELFRSMGVQEPKITPQGNPVFQTGGLEVEIEYRSCACEMNNPVLHADGQKYRGWSNELI
ncbi:MAG TPA: hypothetical protein VI544_00270, partial [Candidatus Nanoarchaeia archaeon]|nr:hypothetical protein [Candidatus Nanoarchaeia archaeon]